MPAETTTCIEISAMRCKVLASKGYKAIEADFLLWAPKCTERFDRIVLNPRLRTIARLFTYRQPLACSRMTVVWWQYCQHR